MKVDVFSRARMAPKKRNVLVASAVVASIAMMAVGGGIAAAAGGLAPPPVNPALVHAPTAEPDRVILTPTETPSTTQNVSWRTSTAVVSPQVQLAEMTDGPIATWRTISATSTVEFVTDLGYSIKQHTAELDALDPNTSYLYRVGDGETWSEWFEFASAGDAGVPFSFIVQGDAQNDVKSYASRTFRAAYEARPYAKAVVHLGDLIDTNIADAEWGEWFGAAGFANSYLNVMATPGNHEYYPGPELSKYWQSQFAYPENGPAETPAQVEAFSETVYYTDFQGVRFISLNASTIGGSNLAVQTEWLDKVLEENPNKWSVVSFHQPVFSVTSGRDNKTLRDAWLPVFEKHNVDLVLQGHDHAYGRGNLFANETNLPEGASADASQTGPVYLVSVAGPKMYVPDDPATNNWISNGANMRSMNRDTQMFQIVDVSQDELHVESRTVTGDLFDGFTITKSDTGEKLVTDDLTPRVSGPGSTRGDIGTPSIPSPTVPGDVTPTPTPTPTPDPTPDPTPTPTDPPTDPPTEPGEYTPEKLELSVTGVAAGGEFSLKVAGFKPNEDVEISIHSDPVVLGYKKADTSGVVSSTLRIPAGIPAGNHRIVVRGLESGALAEAPIRILAAGSESTGVRNLAFTGMGGLSTSLMVGGAVLLLGVAGVVFSRRRRRVDGASS
ncbi:fibronectin type III domain-containing protein [uncultured Salinibacterium sp.]|uniref:fibronectin type III domain-containing protein n=1 Tax=uncultured Salinibacterium sp. TaxID=459274 RepID=UPI0030DDD720|tara:strand:+ start:41285 stop:43288 length:2004 start_codon:yes stop_codon:yes gene_type:complete